jgi:hypothetical protein
MHVKSRRPAQQLEACMLKTEACMKQASFLKAGVCIFKSIRSLHALNFKSGGALHIE